MDVVADPRPMPAGEPQELSVDLLSPGLSGRVRSAAPVVFPATFVIRPHKNGRLPFEHMLDMVFRPLRCGLDYSDPVSSVDPVIKPPLQFLERGRASPGAVRARLRILHFIRSLFFFHRLSVRFLRLISFAYASACCSSMNQFDETSFLNHKNFVHCLTIHDAGA